jgi:hypothetical protein
VASGDLFALARELLDACEGIVATSPGGPIPRSFISPGLPALDCCPQLTVHVGGPAEADTSPLVYPLDPGHRTANLELLNLVQLTITVVRCTPPSSGDEPLPQGSALEDAAEEIDADLWCLWNELRQLHRSGALFDAPAGPGSRDLFFDPAVSLNPQGGCAGWLIPIRVQLGGY